MFYTDIKFIEELTNLCRLACANTLKYHKKSMNVSLKTDASPVTIADLTTNEIIVKGLQKYNIPILSEESKIIPYEKRKDNKYMWIIDPLDGTKEFISGGNDFTVNIGLIHQNTSVFGVVGIPCEKKIYVGIVGMGAWVCDGVLCQNIAVKTSPKLRIVASKSHFSPETKQFIDKFDNPELVNVGSSIKILYIAEGKADIYPRIGLTSEWDTCAAHAIVKASGGNILDLTTRQEIKYNKENILNPHFICTYPKYYAI